MIERERNLNNVTRMKGGYANGRDSIGKNRATNSQNATTIGDFLMPKFNLNLSTFSSLFL